MFAVWQKVFDTEDTLNTVFVFEGCNIDFDLISKPASSQCRNRNHFSLVTQ